MRAIAEQEYARVFGGNSNQDPTVLPTTTVTATPLPPYGNGGFDMWTVGGEYGGGSPIDANNAQNDVDHVDGSDPFNDGQDADDNVSEQEFENTMKFIAQLAEAGELGTDGLGNVFNAVDWTKVVTDVNGDQYTYARQDYAVYEDTMGNAHYSHGYDELFPFRRVDWSEYDEGGKATADQALSNLFHDILVNHHVAIDPATGP